MAYSFAGNVFRHLSRVAGPIQEKLVGKVLLEVNLLNLGFMLWDLALFTELGT